MIVISVKVKASASDADEVAESFGEIGILHIPAKAGFSGSMAFAKLGPHIREDDSKGYMLLLSCTFLLQCCVIFFGEGEFLIL